MSVSGGGGITPDFRRHLSHVIENRPPVTAQTTQTSEIAPSHSSTLSKIKHTVLKKLGLSSNTKVVAKGADKVVSIPSGKIPKTTHTDRQKKAFYTPNRAFGMSRKKQLKAEVEIYKKIQNKLKEKGLDPANSKLAIQHDVLEGKERIKGQYTVEVDKAEGAIDGQINSEMTGIDVMKLDIDARTGLAELHSIDMVAGDSKLDNILVYKDKEGNLSAKVADFGRAKDINGDESIENKGNTRTVDPSGKISKKGEVWSAAVNTLQMLSLLLDDPNSVVDEMMNDAPGATESIAPHPDRKGVEKLVLQHKAFSAVENKGTWIGRVENARRRKNPPEVSADTQSLLMTTYTDKLLETLEEKGKISPDQRQLLSGVLRSSFSVDPEKRPSMADSVQIMQSAMGFKDNE